MAIQLRRAKLIIKQLLREDEIVAYDVFSSQNIRLHESEGNLADPRSVRNFAYKDGEETKPIMLTMRLRSFNCMNHLSFRIQRRAEYRCGGSMHQLRELGNARNPSHIVTSRTM